MNPDATPFQPRQHKKRKPTQRSRNYQKMLRNANQTLHDGELQANQRRQQAMNNSYQSYANPHSMGGNPRETQNCLQGHFHQQQHQSFYQMRYMPILPPSFPGFYPPSNMNRTMNYPTPQFQSHFGNHPNSSQQAQVFCPDVPPPGIEHNISSEHFVKSESFSQTQVFMEYMLNCHKVEYQRGSTEYTDHMVTAKSTEEDSVVEKNKKTLVEKMGNISIEESGDSKKQEVVVLNKKVSDEDDKEKLAQGQLKMAGKKMIEGQEEPKNPHVSQSLKSQNFKNNNRVTKSELNVDTDKKNIVVSLHESPKTVQHKKIPSNSDNRYWNQRGPSTSRNVTSEVREPKNQFVDKGVPREYQNSKVDGFIQGKPKNVKGNNKSPTSGNGNRSNRGQAHRQRQKEGQSKPLFTDKDGYQVPRHTAKWLNCSIDEVVARQRHLDAP